MTIKFIGLKELRQNMSKISREALKKKQRVVVLKQNAPIFELRPLSDADVALWRFEHELEEARKSAREEKSYSTKEIRQMLGLKPYEI